ncbi:glycoside hydrolase [Duganella sp. FT80W]|uniref:Glycoside hydrolase n=1 Tax=Duganella guangzhouensis TaxID=2666084 RepID=A0A6I2KST0_9BURK|nr:glycosyl hydrolase [Duganella guangzhouensis]MRW88571.1 glycoside hydrolase [Duganella guangzhouensis]
MNKKYLWLLLCVTAGAHAASDGVTHYSTVTEVQRHLASPPDDARPMVRWWWFGPAVVKPQLEREMLAMKQGGFGGFEIQPVYPMELDDPARGIRNLPYLSPDFLDAVSFVNRKAHDYKLRVDMTLASGWPYGGPNVPVTEAASRLRVAPVDLPAGADAVALPAIGSGEKLVATFVGAGDAKQFDATRLALTELPSKDGRARVAPAAEKRVVVFYIASRTGQQVKRAALGAEGFVLDHLSRKAIDHHLSTVAEPLMKAFGKQPPYAVFSDSLEVYNTDWTDDFLAEFQRRRGYDLKPYLPVVYSGQGPDAGALRRDWALTQTELVNERYLTPVDDWAKKHNTRFRSQTYGEPAVSLSSNRLVALPEGEGPQFREFSFTRLATSAGHLYGRNVISAETWTWLNSPAFSATPLDMKVEADRMLLQGVNLFIGHGWPYTPPGAQEPGYAFYAAAVFNNHQPWWNVMPDVTAYLQRTSYLLRQGEPANDVALLLPNDDVYAESQPAKVSLSAEMHKHVTPEIMTQILDAGHNVDFLDAEALRDSGKRYPLIVLPHVTRMAPETLELLIKHAGAGGKVIAVGGKPSLAPGFRDAAAVTARVRTLSERLFALPGVRVVEDDAALGAAVGGAVAPDLRVSSQASAVGFIRRKLADGDLYFIANTSNREVRTTVSVAARRAHAAWWNPHDGTTTPISRTASALSSSAPEQAAQAQPAAGVAVAPGAGAAAAAAAAGDSLALVLSPYESRVLVLSDSAQLAPAIAARAAAGGTRVGTPGGPGATDARSEATLVALDGGWQLSFPAAGGTLAQPRALSALTSWADDPATRYYSGIGVYTTDIALQASQLTATRIKLDFGVGTPLDSTPKVPAGMRAMLDSPIREAAVVYVNGQRAGAVWHPPYQVDVTKLLKPGTNRIEVQVANLSINMLAGQERPDYRLLSARYGQRFVPQDTHLITPRPSGMLGQVRLLTENAQ